MATTGTPALLSVSVRSVSLRSVSLRSPSRYSLRRATHRCARVAAAFLSLLQATACGDGSTEPSGPPRLPALGRYAYRFDATAAPGTGTTHVSATLTITQISETHLEAHVAGAGVLAYDIVLDAAPPPDAPPPMTFTYDMYEVGPPDGNGGTEEVTLAASADAHRPTCRASYRFYSPTTGDPTSGPATCSLAWVGP